MAKRVPFPITPGLIPAAETKLARLLIRGTDTIVPSYGDTEAVEQFTNNPARGFADFDDETPAGSYDFVLAINETFGFVVGIVTFGSEPGVYYLWNESSPVIAITPGSISQDRRDDNQLQIECYIGETIAITRSVFDGSDPPLPVDLSGMDLQFVVETKSRVAVEAIEDITTGGDDNNSFTFNLTAAITSQARTLECSLRNLADGKRVWGKGQINVKYAPLVVS